MSLWIWWTVSGWWISKSSTCIKILKDDLAITCDEIMETDIKISKIDCQILLLYFLGTTYKRLKSNPWIFSINSIIYINNEWFL